MAIYNPLVLFAVALGLAMCFGLSVPVTGNVTIAGLGNITNATLVHNNATNTTFWILPVNNTNSSAAKPPIGWVPVAGQPHPPPPVQHPVQPGYPMQPAPQPGYPMQPAYPVQPAFNGHAPAMHPNYTPGQSGNGNRPPVMNNKKSSAAGLGSIQLIGIFFISSLVITI